ncbi:hypothetical protein CQW23_22778 [Capsicum baccatum]|uniref:FBD domain-containing protein n=1 Tax=Capsicum baccatum TaxID=33114 RepID=A0A2G2W1U7_CAPBA|nr:hypothetical protein CQW23_22778 [Capsicum baccatum]
MLQTLLARCPLIETFIIRHCSGLTKIEVSNLEKIKFNLRGSHSLKFLKIVSCKGIGEINAPNLVTLEYDGDRIPELKLKKESSQLENSKLILYSNNSWFCKLRKFLSNAKSWSQVTLKLLDCDVICRHELKLNHAIANAQVDPYPQVDVLNVEINVSGQYQTFLDALLWSCRPRRLSLLSNGEMIKCFIDNLTDKKYSSAYYQMVE